MSEPEIVQSALGDAPVAARVSLGGEDTLYVTPSRTLVYRAEGLLSDETVTEYRHDAERIEVSEGRRKSKITLEYGLDGEESIALPASKLEDALHPVLAGVLNAAGITDAGESVKRTFRFSELTLVVTSARVVKHIGASVWDEDFEEYHYGDVTDLTFEEGNVATSVVLTMGDRQERFKTPNDAARAVREALEGALLAYHDVGSLEALRSLTEDDSESREDAANVSFGAGPEPLSANPSELAEQPENATASEGGAVSESLERPAETGGNGTGSGAGASGFEESGFQAVESVADDAVETELAALREAIEAQNERLARQEQLIETLIAELRQGR